MADRSLLGQVRERLSRGTVLSSVVVVAASGALLAAALGAEGYRTPELELHDAGIWLSRSDAGDIGRLNSQIKEVDVRIDLGAGADALLQHDSVVWVHNSVALPGSLCSVDGRSAKATASMELPDGARVDLNGLSGGQATGALLAGGQLWVEPDDGLFAIGLPPAPSCQSPQGAPPAEGSAGQAEPTTEEAQEPPPADQEVPDATELVVGTDGVAWTYAPETGVLRGFDALGVLAGEAKVAAVPTDHPVQLTTVGSTPVVLDQETDEILLPGSDAISIDDEDLGGDPELQLAGPARDEVLIGTSAGLVEVPLTGGPAQLVTEGGPGQSARPLFHGGCAYGAWSATPTYSVDCPGRHLEAGPLPGGTKGNPLRFRTNRGKVAINDLQGGDAFLLGDGTPDPINWDDAVIDPQDTSDDPSDATTQRPEDAEEQVPPVAEPDTGKDAFATRPDQAIVIHPMRNDHDANKADVLVIKGDIEDLSGCECIELVDGGLAVQVTPPAGSFEDIRFRYTINDGQADSQPAEAVVEIHREEQNDPPTLKDQATSVVSGGTIVHNVLADAVDPDGDPLSLLVPVAPPAADGSQGTLTAAVDGTITFHAPGGTEANPSFVGEAKVPFTITDGREGGDLPATLTVTVTDPKDPNRKPAARGDHAEAVVGHEVVVDVLANDSDADGDPLRVTHPGSSDIARVVQDDQDRIHVTPTTPGPLILEYSISDGKSEEVKAKLRIDVLADTGALPPVAVRDDVVLSAGAVVVLDVLRNDTDANGDVLIVEGVEGAEAAGLAVEVLEYRFLRIRASRALDRPAAFTYSVTDGSGRDRATVVVRPGPAVEQQPPTVNDDAYRVRAGAIAALDVLANDSDPEGVPLRIKPGSVLAPGYETAVFVQDGKLRFAAPASAPPSPVVIEYAAIDGDDKDGRFNSASVVVTVVADGPENSPPEPLELTARTVAGVPVVIPIPVATIDPDGDDVTLLGLSDGPDAAPTHGSVTEVGNDRLTYVPDQWDAGFYGTDAFTYKVRDAKGLESVAIVRVGVAAPPSQNHPPVAIEDERQATDAGLTVDVLRNDSDPDGDDLSFVPDSLVKLQADAPYEVEITDTGRVKFSPKDLEPLAEVSFTYQVTDGILTSVGLVTIEMSEDLPIAPIALDDRHPATQVGAKVEIDILANDVDPDGSRDELIVASVQLVAGLDTAPASANPLRFTMPAADVVLRYTIEDESGETADAIVRVRHAAAEKIYPPTAAYDEAETDENAQVTVDVLENDEVTPGREKVLLDVAARDHGACAATGDGKVVYTPEPGFTGLGGCSYVLGDGPGDSPTTLRATGTVGVRVHRSSNSPPRFIGQTLTVYADDVERTFDLRSAVVDPDDPDQEQRVQLGDPEGATGAVSASIKGTVLHLKADNEAVEGEVVLTFSVNDGTDPSAEPGRVVVLVSKYNGPLAALAPDEIETFEDAVSAPKDVLANDQRAVPEDPLTIVGVTGPADGGTVDFEPGGTVVFRPTAGFHGVREFTYTVDDGTKQAEREVTANVTVTVVGFPDAPAPPSLERFDSAIGLSWAAPADNGAPITEYLVEATGGAGSRTERTSSTSFRFGGLKNNDSYTFRIAALNRATQDGQARFSVPSPVIIPNTVPNTPAPPLAKFDPAGNAIDVTWTDPGSLGSPVGRYLLTANPASSTMANPIIVSAPTTSHHVTGLVNGTGYVFTVQAVSTITDSQGTNDFSSGVSAPSVPEIPAAPPAAPTRPTINPADLGDSNITIHWVEPVTNGDAISAYHVTYFVNGTSVGTQTVPGTERQTTIQNTDNDKKYTFSVVAENKAGKGAASPQSDPVNSYGVPGPIGAISATEGDRSSVLTFQRPAENGSTIDQYQYKAPNVNGGNWTPIGHTMAGTTVTINVAYPTLTNGTTYQFQVRAHNARDWATDPGRQSEPAVRPFGTPFSPPNFQGCCNGSQTFTWTWSPATIATLNGHDSPVEYRVSVNGELPVAASSPYVISVGWDQCRDVKVQVIGNRTTAPNRQTGGFSSTVQLCSGPAPPPPLPTARATSTGPTFCTAEAGGCGPHYNNVVAGNDYVIRAACQTNSDIGTGNGWWYQLNYNGEWASATLFSQKQNQFGAPRTFGGGSSTCY